MMSLPQFVRELVERKLSEYCENKIPEHARSQIRLKHKVRGNSVTLFEERPDFIDKNTWIEITVAQFRYHPSNKKWSLYYRDRNSRWHEYWDIDSDPDLDVLLQEVNEDPTGIFWG
jgi:hypothetical protein